MIRAAMAALIALMMGGHATAEDSGQPGIRETISAQIEAFRADDFPAAFRFASPAIRRIFQTPENFGVMVREGYPMVWRPADVTFLKAEQRGERTFQQVMVRGPKGALHVLEYEMIRVNGQWRIDAVAILESSRAGV